MGRLVVAAWSMGPERVSLPPHRMRTTKFITLCWFCGLMLENSFLPCKVLQCSCVGVGKCIYYWSELYSGTRDARVELMMQDRPQSWLRENASVHIST